MKKLLLLFAFVGIVLGASSQSKSYFSAASEMLFSMGDVQIVDSAGNTQEPGTVVRWAPVLNIQGAYNYNPSKAFGVFLGLSIRNIGYIADDPLEDNIRYKYRTYNFGIPVGVKIGSMEKFFAFGGYEIEFPFHYKEKKFIGDDKDSKITGWFSDRVEPFQQSWFVGIEIPNGINLKFKYYFTDFHNKEFSYTENGDLYKPYANRTDRIYYFSISYNLFTPADDYKEMMDDWK